MKKLRMPAPIPAILVVLVSIGAISLSGCLGGGNTNPPPAGNTVNIISTGYVFAFSPNAMTVHVGENVTWVNNAGTDHLITSDNATDPFNSGILPAGHSFTHEFNRVGVFPYHCAIHTYMTGTITVIQ
jgi:plastocyanin